jgi:hypothetical protein
MSDRRAVLAGHLGASSVAAANEPWRVAVGGNRVENMTVDQIARAFQSGHLNVRTPLWPPGTTGWQALGNFEQFQGQPQGGAGYGAAAYGNTGNAGYDNAGYDNSGRLSQFEEADDDPTRMWTGTGDIDLPGMQDMQPPPPPMEQRPSARTGPRQVSRPMQSQAPSQQQYPSQSMPSQAPPLRAAPMPSHTAVAARPAPMPMAPPAPSLASRTPALVPSSASPYRQKSRGNGLMLVAGLVGLVGLGSAILAARGNWGSASEPAPASAEAAAPEKAAPAAEPVAEAPRAEPVRSEPATAEPAKVEGGEAQLAKYEDGTPPASAFVAGEPTKTEKAEKAEAAADEPGADAKKRDRQDAEPREPAAKAEKAAKSARVRSETTSKRVSSRAAPRRAAVAAAALPRQKPAPTPPPSVEKIEKVEKAEAVEAPQAPQAPANSAVNQNAAAALANSANLAASCRPRGGPAGAGKARVIYSNDGEVQSVEILTAKFRDTLTGSCVRMVFRRAKIPAFKGEPPTFIKSFTIPEE